MHLVSSYGNSLFCISSSFLFSLSSISLPFSHFFCLSLRLLQIITPSSAFIPAYCLTTQISPYRLVIWVTILLHDFLSLSLPRPLFFFLSLFFFFLFFLCTISKFSSKSGKMFPLVIVRESGIKCL